MSRVITITRDKGLINERATGLIIGTEGQDMNLGMNIHSTLNNIPTTVVVRASDEVAVADVVADVASFPVINKVAQYGARTPPLTLRR